MNNEDLAMIAKSGDQAALAELYKNNKGVIRLAAGRFSRNNEDFEDLMQIGMIAIIDAVRAYDGKYVFLTYLKWTMHHHFYKYATNQYKLVCSELTDDLIESLVYHPARDVIAEDILGKVLECMRSTLDEKNYKIMLEHICLDKSFAEIGMNLGIGRERVRMREVRSIKKLQENKDLQRIAAEYFGRKE